ncbi:glycine cleavage system aminomethyltransferase GcvT [Actinomadura scrupuli]|uniref:glycine cleavage system aminomethyltransferase GcvT n=1 Tax=Actinomadura scrupuli TaxID=559629 RepID=UPI003D967E23
MSAPPEVKRTPLHEIHEGLGANLVDFAGYLMPLRYGSETAEHVAVRTSAGLFDISHMGEIFVSGPQAARALDYALVGNLSALAVGRARYTMICDAAGGVLDDLIVYRLADETFMVVANASNVAVVREALIDRVHRRDAAEGAGPGDAGYDAVVDDRSEAYALLAVQGPKAQEILFRVTRAPLADLKYYAILAGEVAGIDALIGRTGYTGEDGFELFVSSGDAAALWHALVEAGGDDLRPAGLSARDTLRLEAGMPLYGNELSTETTPYDAGLGRVVKLDKEGDFVGREALTALADTPPGRTLVGLVAKGRRVPRHGYAVVTTGEQGGTPCGVVTSGAPSPTLGRPIAMAYLDTGAGTDELAVDIRGRHEPVDVVPLPFYKRVSP